MMCGAPARDARSENPCASLEAFDRREMDVELASFEVAAGRCEDRGGTRRVTRCAAGELRPVERRRQEYI